MRLSFLVPLLLLGAGCATGSGSGSVLVVETYSVSDIASDPAKAPQISTADLAQVVRDAAGIKGEQIGNSNTIPDRPEPASPRVQGPIVAVNPAAEPPSGTAFSTLSWPAQRPLPARIISGSSAAAPRAPLSL